MLNDHIDMARNRAARMARERDPYRLFHSDDLELGLAENARHRRVDGMPQLETRHGFRLHRLREFGLVPQVAHLPRARAGSRKRHCRFADSRTVAALLAEVVENEFGKVKCGHQ